MTGNVSLNTVVAESHAGAHEPGFLNPDLGMALLTWLTFFLLFAILYKFAWEPILNALDARELAIRQAVENVDRAKEELTKIEEIRNKVLTEANTQAKELIENSRKGAHEAARIIQYKAKEEAQILLENAQREIREEKERAQADLREESARVAVALAEKLIEANLDDDRNRKLINQLIKEI